MPWYNPIKSTKTARDKTRAEKTDTRKPVPYRGLPSDATRLLHNTARCRVRGTLSSYTLSSCKDPTTCTSWHLGRLLMELGTVNLAENPELVYAFVIVI